MGLPTKYPHFPESPKVGPGGVPKYETREDTGFRAARHYQTQSAATGTESLWRFMHMASDMRTWRVRTLTDHLNSILKWPFYKESKA